MSVLRAGLTALLLLGVSAGCAGLPRGDGARAPDTARAAEPAADPYYRSRVQQLRIDLLALGPGVDPEEASQVAEVAILYPLQLAGEYQLTTPPLWHNTLVNFGMRPRGLCIDWTQDLLTRLGELRLRSLDLYWGVANNQAVFRIEHSTAIVSPRGRGFGAGMVLDPWRASGELFWSRVGEDPDYRWENLSRVRERRAAIKSLNSELTPR